MKVMIATPCYISAVSMNYVTSMFDLVAFSKNVGLNCALYMHSESLITRARNRMTATFLKEESFTHLMWIDSDIAFRPEQVFRLLQADRDVVTGVYPLKNLNWPPEGVPAGMTQAQFETRYSRYAFNSLDHGKTPVGQHVDSEGFIEVSEAPTGFMAIKRDVFTRMIKHYPDLNYTPDGAPDNPDKHLYWLFFDCMIDPDTNRYLSEDYAFCRRWRDMGGRIWADSTSNLQHLGQHTFSGNLAESLKAQGLW